MILILHIHVHVYSKQNIQENILHVHSPQKEYKKRCEKIFKTISYWSRIGRVRLIGGEFNLNTLELIFQFLLDCHRKLFPPKSHTLCYNVHVHVHVFLFAVIFCIFSLMYINQSINQSKHDCIATTWSCYFFKIMTIDFRFVRICALHCTFMQNESPCYAHGTYMYMYYITM